jgi:phytoene dehydrogenase-like protein
MEANYSLIVIGAGVTGLSTALAWRKAFPNSTGDVLVVEKNPIVGGCVSTFARKGYRFDTTQIIPDLRDLLDFFEIDIDLVKFEGYYARLFMANSDSGSVRIANIPSSAAAFEKYLTDKYPEDKLEIGKFFKYCIAMHAELGYLKTELKWHQLPRILFKCPKIIATSNKTYHQFLSTFGFTNPEVFRILDTFSSFSGLPGNRCAALLTACAMVTTLKGSYRPQKGFIQFPLKLKQQAENQGIEIRKHHEVSEILIEKGKVKGVKLAGGEKILSPNVVCTADTKLTFEKLVGLQQIKELNAGYAHKVESVKMSPSAFSIHLGLDEHIDLAALGFNCGYNVLSSGDDAFEKLFQAWDAGQLIQSDDCFHMAVISPSLITGGKNTLIIRVVPVYAPYWILLKEENPAVYAEEKHKIAEFYINKVQQYMIPELNRHIVFKDISTPATFKRYIGTPTGSQYDMQAVPDNFGKNRLRTRTPVKGLFVPKFSHGIWPGMQAGLQVIDMITGGKIMNGNSSYKPSKQ